MFRDLVISHSFLKVELLAQNMSDRDVSVTYYLITLVIAAVISCLMGLSDSLMNLLHAELLCGMHVLTQNKVQRHFTLPLPFSVGQSFFQTVFFCYFLLSLLSFIVSVS